MTDLQALYTHFLAHPQVVTDTRKIVPGALFFALKGASFDGNAFAHTALEKGAAFAIIDDAAFATDTRCLLVENVLETLQELARHHRRHFSIPVLGITGSNGKTTTKELVLAVMQTAGETLATEGNLNNHIGVPLTLLRLRPEHRFAIVEMGANHQGEIASYCQIAEPTYGLITNCGKAHLEGFGGEAGVRKGKGELFDYLRKTGGMVLRNTDAEYLKEMAAGIEKQRTYGTSESADVRGLIGRNEAGEMLHFEVSSAGKTASVTTQLVGSYNLPNALAAIAVGTYFGVSLEDCAVAISNYEPQNSRSQLLIRGNNRVVLDAYNANPTSMRAAIEAFAKSHAGTGRLWLGAMREMGNDSQQEHRELVDFIQQWPWKQVLLVGTEYAGLHGTYSGFETVSEAVVALLSAYPFTGETILLKGSRGSRMEEMLTLLPADEELSAGIRA